MSFFQFLIDMLKELINEPNVINSLKVNNGFSVISVIINVKNVSGRNNIRALRVEWAIQFKIGARPLLLYGPR